MRHGKAIAEVEAWMTKNRVEIVCLQEAKGPHSKQINTKLYTWYFSGNDLKIRDNKGVGFATRNELKTNYIFDILPISSGVMVIKMKGTCPITYINVYAPTADKSQTEKD